MSIQNILRARERRTKIQFCLELSAYVRVCVGGCTRTGIADTRRLSFDLGSRERTQPCTTNPSTHCAI